MDRFLLYRIGFIVTLVLYIVLRLTLGSFVENIVTIVFFLSSLYFVFTTDSIPRKYLNNPAVHLYYRSRVNSYGYTMALSLVFSAIAFAILSVNTPIYPGVIVLFLWLLMISVVYIHRRITGGKEGLVDLLIVDYILENLPEQHKVPNVRTIIFAIKALFIETNITVVEIYKELKKEFIDTNPETLKEILKLFIIYLRDNENILISDEIEAINSIVD